MNKILEYAKAVVAAVGGLVTVVVVAWADKAISVDEIELIVAAIGVVFTALGVAKVENQDPV